MVRRNGMLGTFLPRSAFVFQTVLRDSDDAYAGKCLVRATMRQPQTSEFSSATYTEHSRSSEPTRSERASRRDDACWKVAHAAKDRSVEGRRPLPCKKGPQFAITM